MGKLHVLIFINEDDAIEAGKTEAGYIWVPVSEKIADLPQADRKVLTEHALAAEPLPEIDDELRALALNRVLEPTWDGVLVGLEKAKDMLAKRKLEEKEQEEEEKAAREERVSEIVENPETLLKISNSADREWYLYFPLWESDKECEEDPRVKKALDWAKEEVERRNAEKREREKERAREKEEAERRLEEEVERNEDNILKFLNKTDKNACERYTNGVLSKDELLRLAAKAVFAVFDAFTEVGVGIYDSDGGAEYNAHKTLEALTSRQWTQLKEMEAIAKNSEYEFTFSCEEYYYCRRDQRCRIYRPSEANAANAVPTSYVEVTAEWNGLKLARKYVLEGKKDKE